MPRSRSIAIQSERVERRSRFALTCPARLIAPPNSNSFSVNVVLPASGWEMIANVRRRSTSAASGVTAIESEVPKDLFIRRMWQGKAAGSRGRLTQHLGILIRLESDQQFAAAGVQHGALNHRWLPEHERDGLRFGNAFFLLVGKLFECCSRAVEQNLPADLFGP